MKKSGLLVLFVIYLQASPAQIPTTQDCLGAIPICSKIHLESNLPTGFGAYDNEVNQQFSCLVDERNSLWFRFTVNNSGNFGFMITPNVQTEDFDWALWDMTRSRCEDIVSNSSIMVSCNAAGGGACVGNTGATGFSPYRVQGMNCGNLPPSRIEGYTTHNALIPVKKGNNYVLVVSNFSGTSNGFQIDFGLSDDIGIFDLSEPEVLEWTTNSPGGCIPQYIEIEFSEAVQCATISNENFQIADENGNLYEIESASRDCEIGAPHTKFVRIDLLDSIEFDGRYFLEMRPTTEYPVLDLCGNPSKPFIDTLEVVEHVLMEINLPEDTILCRLNPLVVDVADIQASHYSWSDGSSDPVREITQPGTYAVTVSNNCDVKTAILDIIETNCEECHVYIPNIFSPDMALNPDNALYVPKTNCPLTDYRLLIYDRWGNLHFESADLQKSWDGRGNNGLRASEGIYIYLLSYAYSEFGTTIRKQTSGDLLLSH